MQSARSCVPLRCVRACKVSFSQVFYTIKECLPCRSHPFTLATHAHHTQLTRLYLSPSKCSGLWLKRQSFPFLQPCTSTIAVSCARPWVNLMTVATSVMIGRTLLLKCHLQGTR